MQIFQEFKASVAKPRVLNPQEYAEIQEAATFYIYDPEVSYELFKLWHKFFVENNFNPSLISSVFDTFWKWYVIVTFKNFVRHPISDLLDILPHQAMMDFRLGYDLPVTYINYHMTYIPEDQDQRDFHRAVSERILTTTIPFDYKNGMPLNQLITKLRQKDRLDRIEYSNILGMLENFVFPDEIDTTQSAEEKQDTVQKLIDFLLFIAVPKAIDEMRELYTKTASYLPTSVFADLPPVDDIDGNTGESSSEKENSAIHVPPEEKNSLTYVSIRDRIVAEVRKKSLKQSSDEYMSFVFEELQKYSDESGDPRVLDLYYYDEQSGKFVWNEELLSSS